MFHTDLSLIHCTFQAKGVFIASMTIIPFLPRRGHHTNTLQEDIHTKGTPATLFLPLI